MKAAVLVGPGRIEIEDRPAPEVGSGEVLLRIRAVGVCGSDIHYFRHGRIGPYVVRYPFVLGHECSGEVAAVGAGVRGWKEGDRVAVEPGVPCGRCDSCKQGRYNLCPDVVFLATPPVDGALVEYLRYSPDFLFRLPDGMGWDEGAMLEPLCVGIHAAHRARVSVGDAVAVLGCGPVGLLAIGAARSFGAAEVLAVDVDPSRLKAAARMGAARTIEGGPGAVDEILRLTAGRGVDVAIETAGSDLAVRQSVLVARRGGRVVWVGLGRDEVAVPVALAVDRELDIRGLFRYANHYPRGIRLVSSGAVDVRSLVTHRFGFDAVGQAFATAADRAGGAIKVMIDV